MTITSAVPRTVRTKLQLVMPWGMILRRGDPAGLDGQTSVSGFVFDIGFGSALRFSVCGTSSCEYRGTAIRKRGSTAPSAMSGALIRHKAQKWVDEAALKSRPRLEVGYRSETGESWRDGDHGHSAAGVSRSPCIRLISAQPRANGILLDEVSSY